MLFVTECILALFKICWDPAPVRVVERNKKLLSFIRAKPLYIDLALISVPKGAGKRQADVGTSNLPGIDFDLKGEGRGVGVGGGLPLPRQVITGICDCVGAHKFLILLLN